MFEEGIFANGVFRSSFDRYHDTPYGYAEITDEHTDEGKKYITASIIVPRGQGDLIGRLVTWSSESFAWTLREEEG